MKELVALCAGLAIAAAAALWFTTGPVVVNAEVRPLQASANVPSFKPVPTELDGRSSRDTQR